MINFKEEKEIIQLINNALKINILPKKKASLLGPKYETTKKHITKISFEMDKEERPIYNKIPAEEIKKNEIRYMPTEIGKLEYLETIGWRHALMGNLPEEIGKLKKLKIMTIESKVITELPQSIGEMESLESLQFTCELMKTLPKSIGNLQNLKNIRLYETPKDFYLPETLLNASNLNKIDFCRTTIDDIPVFLASHPSLKTIALFNVHMEKFPKSLAKFQNLETLFWRNTLRNIKTPQIVDEIKKIGIGTYGEIRGEALEYLRNNI
ncbi:MAG: hypothetical protein JXA99_02905 [Candidatus Lokiarchaeota archaeon]|nr:hypothetical protein [Candidatus Lokiarchaeota archaeon]